MALVLLNRAPGIDGVSACGTGQYSGVSWYGKWPLRACWRRRGNPGGDQSPMPGWWREVLVLPGDRVGPDDPLLVMSSPDLERNWPARAGIWQRWKRKKPCSRSRTRIASSISLAQLAQAEAEIHRRPPPD